MAVQRPSRRLHRRRLFFYPLTGTEHGSQPSLTTRDRELVSVLEVRIEPGDLNPRPLTQQSVTLPTLPRARSDDLVTLGVTFDSKMTFEKHLRSVSRAASQILGFLRKCWRVFHCSMIDRFFGDAFGVLSCPFWSTFLQCGARLPIHTVNNWTAQSVVPGS